MKNNLLAHSILLFFITINSAFAQDADKRFSFAESYIGFDLISINSFSNGYNIENDRINEFSRNPILKPCLNLGATHFWGHADFYISIPLTEIKMANDDISNELNYRVLTGMRIYPLKLESQGFRPFLGYKFSANNYRQEVRNDQFTEATRVKSIFDAGIAYKSDNYYLYASYNRLINPDLPIYLTPGYEAPNQVPVSFFNIGINLLIETTYTKQTEDLIALNKKLSNSNKHGFYFGIGPSSAFLTQSSEYMSEKYPFLNEYSMPGVFPDIALGYHLTKYDIMVDLAFRPITLRRNGLGIDQTIRRRSLIFEVLKGLGDYHGFVPFIGPGLAYDNIELIESNEGIETLKMNNEVIHPTFTFGWDIRPNKNTDWLILRTNLRYSPFLNFDIEGLEFGLQQLEFNFIQVNIYPGRKKMAR